MNKLIFLFVICFITFNSTSKASAEESCLFTAVEIISGESSKSILKFPFESIIEDNNKKVLTKIFTSSVNKKCSIFLKTQYEEGIEVINEVKCTNKMTINSLQIQVDKTKQIRIGCNLLESGKKVKRKSVYDLKRSDNPFGYSGYNKHLLVSKELKIEKSLPELEYGQMMELFSYNKNNFNFFINVRGPTKVNDSSYPYVTARNDVFFHFLYKVKKIEYYHQFSFSKACEAGIPFEWNVIYKIKTDKNPFELKYNIDCNLVFNKK